MKQSIGPGIVAAVVAVVLAIVGVIGYKTLFHDPNDTPVKTEAAAQKVEATKKESAIYKRVMSAHASGNGHGAYGH